jgi:hypothetical protein
MHEQPALEATATLESQGFFSELWTPALGTRAGAMSNPQIYANIRFVSEIGTGTPAFGRSRYDADIRPDIRQFTVAPQPRFSQLSVLGGAHKTVARPGEVCPTRRAPQFVSILARLDCNENPTKGPRSLFRGLNCKFGLI